MHRVAALPKDVNATHMTQVKCLECSRGMAKQVRVGLMSGAVVQDAKWANSDILLVSDGELRQPGQEVMRKLAGAKDKLALRVHGLIVGE